jgi:hypothetical protein
VLLFAQRFAHHDLQTKWKQTAAAAVPLCLFCGGDGVILSFNVFN